MKYAFTLIAIALGMLLYAEYTQTVKTEKQMMKDKIQIEVWSDVVCPFCLLGKKKMEQAIAKYNAQDKVEIIWRSFQLDPSFPKNTSTPSKENLVNRKGYPKAQVDAMCGQLESQGSAYAIHFDFDKAVTFNTWDAHRLIQWSKTQQKSHELKEALMKAHFGEGKDLSQQEQLLSVVKNVGLDEQQANEVLNSEQYTAEVQQDLAKAQSLGIRGVPYFLINGEQVISGAQSDAVFERMVLNGLSNLTETADTSSAGVCTPEGECK